MVYDTEFEEYQLGNKLILDLKFEEEFDLYEIDFTHKKIIKSSIKDNKTLKYYDNYLKDDSIDDCFNK
jgi:hypothetical protein